MLVESPKEGITIGSHPPFRWLTSTEQYIGTLVRRCPEVVVGRHLAVTSIDSGSPWLTDKQESAGWQRRSGIVYSGRVSTTDELFYQRDGPDYPGYDEWYVFDTGPSDLGELMFDKNPFEPAHAPRPGQLVAFVNFLGFTIHTLDPTEQFLVSMFWKQLEWVQPESYMSDGQDCLTFVSRNAVLFDTVYGRLKAAL
jgi:hypothetical protein